MIAELINQVATLLQSQLHILILVFDFLIKCTLLVLIIRYTERSLFPYLASAHKHKLWMTATLLLGLLPIASMLPLAIFGERLSTTNLTFITILVPSGIAARVAQPVTESSEWIGMIAAVYFLVLSYFLLQLCISFRRIRSLRKSANFTISQRLKRSLDRVKRDMGVTQDVQLGFSASVSTPLTFGLRRPVVILPASIDIHDSELLENVLTHELAHIKRRDWIIFLVGFLLAALNWFNPFIWSSLRKMRLEAEFACDGEVVRCGARKEDFAQQLVNLAKQCLSAEKPELFARAAINRPDLRLRVEQLLSNTVSVSPGKRVFDLLSILYIPIVFALISVGDVFALKDESNYATENLRLVHSETPIYPDYAFDKGIQGFMRYSFTVDEYGDVDRSSIKLEQAEKEHLFHKPSLDALSGFKFKPRKVNGKPSATYGVTYSFNYMIQS